MNKTNHKEKYKVSCGNNQLVLILNSEIILPEDAPVRVSSAQLEELDYRKLYEAYSFKGRKSVADPRVLFKVMAYGYQCGIYSSRKLEEACKYRVDFMWLLENGKAPDHSTLSRFRTGRCAGAVEDLFYLEAGTQTFCARFFSHVTLMCIGKRKEQVREDILTEAVENITLILFPIG